MKTVTADFVRLNQRQDVAVDKLSTPLGTVEYLPNLKDLYEGEEVLLIEPGNLKALGYIHIVERDGVWYYFGVVTGPVEDDE